MKVYKMALAVLMLTLVSIGAVAQVKVVFGEKGEEKFPGTGGTITVSQDTKGDEVTVTLTVTPDKGYTITKGDIKVYATYPPSGTRTPEIADNLTLYYNGSEKEDVKDPSAKRDYTFTIGSNFGAWVKEANFQPKKRDGAKGTDYSGTYYIAMPGTGTYVADNPANNYYLVPTEGWCYFVTPNTVQAENNGQPFLTTYKCGHVKNAKWIIQKHTTEDKYYIIHLADGKYLTYNGQLSEAGANRVRVHLEASITGDNNLFTITKSGDNYFISPETGQYLNVTDGNKDSYAGASGKSDGPTGYKNVSGIIGRWNEANNTSQFRFEATTSIDAPTITDNNNGTYTISAAEGATIYYTTDGNTPTTSSYTGTGTTSVNITQTESMTVIKAIAKAAIDAIPTDVTTYNLPACEAPVITFDYTTSKVSIVCATPSSTIYYTTDGSVPTTSSTVYGGLFSVAGSTTVKAFATKSGIIPSTVAELAIAPAATPTIQNNGSNAISITSATPGATIYYTTDGSTPTTSSAVYSSPLTNNVSNVTIKAIAYKENMIPSAVGSGSVTLKCATPTIKRVGLTFTLSCSMPTDAALYYSINGGSKTSYSGPVAFTTDQLPMTVTAVARHSNYDESEETSMEFKTGSGTPDDPYLISGGSDFSDFITNVNNGTAADKCFMLISDVSGSGVSAITNTFSGTLEAAFDPETQMPYRITDLSAPLFTTLTGTVKNLVLESVSISNTGNTGAIACTANGAARIYNVGILSGSVGGTTNTGGIVGFLDGTARVINCYSYANITGGTNVAGIVGNNNYASKMNDVRTMVVNCMFYGEITGNTIKPVYGGKSISNKGTTGINNYNYFRGSAAFNTETTFSSSDAYYCSWPASEEYLTRFEYYRSILNSNRQLCTWWVNGTSGTTPTDEDVNNVGIAKWVLDPNIAPYPILKEWGKYPSVINQDKEYTYNPDTKQKVSRASAPAYQGKKLGTLSVSVNAGSGHQGSGSTSEYLNCIVLDMDTLNYDYGYAKIQLPYYNEVFGNPEAADHANRYAGNYTDKAVTGWKVTNVLGGTSGTFEKAWEDGYNFADRNCTSKDLYETSGRVFAQGGYYYVPEGVTSITIEAYWADKVIYLHNNEHSLDRVNVASGGTKAGIGTSFSPAGTLPETFQGKTVYTTLQNAIGQLTASESLTVYDQAIVLVGNVQVKNLSASVGHTGGAANNKPFTIMSIDQDLDNEPDYCLELQFRSGTDRPTIHPIRFDFLPIPELGLAIKTDSKAYAIGIMVPLGHFEITETAFMHTTQFEYDGANRNAEGPMILNGGQFEQIVIRYGSKDHTNYFLMGGNFRMSRFTPGYHATPDNKGVVRHCAVNAIGGDFPEFYLSGIYRPDLGVNADNPHCYINGGRFGTIAGAGYEQVNGNVTFQIDHAVIDEFYGGGMNSAKPVTGKIDVTINNSIVYDKYCGGPMVGEMTKTEGVRKTVTTNATNTIFGQYFGGGNGGTSYYREQAYDTDTSWPSDWKSSNFKFNTFNPLNTASISKKYDAAKGYHDMFEYEVFNQSNGVNDNVVARSFIRHAQFGTTITGTVTNNLTNCTISSNFYGGGNLGTVDGNVISTLDNTVIGGSAFGAGYSAAIPQFRRHDRDKVHIPARNKSGQIVEQGYLEYYQDGGKDVYYRWTNDNNNGTATTDAPTYYSEADGEWKCYTPISLEGLGAVSGKATLTINGTTTVAGSVYGGGEESVVNGDTEVSVTGGIIGTTSKGGATWGNVYGGGKGKEKDVTAGLVKGNTTVSISGSPTIIHNIYGGGAYGSVGDFNYDATTGMPTALKTANTGACTVTITGGTFGSDGKENGMVFGSSRGDVAIPEGTPAVDPNDRMAWVYSTHVTIGDAGEATSPTIKGSVYGSGENGHTFQNTIVDINKGIIGITDTNIDGGAAYAYRGNVYGGGCGTDMYDSNGDTTKDAYNPLAGIVQGTTTINIAGGQVVHNVYGAGAMGSVGGKTTINVTGGRIGYNGDGNGHVFGAARGEYGVSTAASGLANVRETEVNINYTTTPTADNDGKTAQLIAGSVFGGGEAGTVKESVAVNMTGGLVLKDVYGGGALADTQTSNWDATANENAGGWADADKKSALHTTTVRLTGGLVGEEVYGGGLGETGKPAYVWGDVKVELNKGIKITGVKGCVVNQIFGCNNLNGTPKGDVEVHVYNTQRAGATQIVNDDNVTNAKVAGTQDSNGDFDLNSFDVAAVYGGGNQADYIPVDGTNQKTYVVIEGCDRTSIGNVYGGGNAAAVPGTHVLIKGSYEIGEVFGGGNGAKEGTRAHVGKYNESEEDYTLGDGKALVQLMAGKVKFVYGGSNTRGNIRGGATVNNVDNEWTEGCCENMQVGQIFAGGKNADMASGADVILGCTNSNDWVEEIYAGARRANVGGDVSLTITSGKFGRVFGGNMISGKLNGSITVNIEENGVCGIPVIIGELYGGGNLAPYSIYGYNDDGTVKTSGDNPHASPVVNVRAFTSIGNIFGGGYGNSAVMVGSPTVNINEAAINHTDEDVTYNGNQFSGTNLYFVNSVLDLSKTSDPTDMTNVYKVVVPDHTDGKMGAIGNIYGGGNAAEVQGDTHVNIGTDTEVYVVRPDLTVTDKVKGFYTRSWDSATKTYDYTLIEDADKTAEEGVNYYQKRDVAGADIRGNVYGGGNEAEVTGSTNVVVGKKAN